MNKVMLENGVVIEKCTPELVENVASTPDVSVMRVGKGQAIVEHKHGNSMYFAKNVLALTIKGVAHRLPKFSWVFIPKGVPHGWKSVQSSSTKGEIFSYHPNHKKYTIA